MTTELEPRVKADGDDDDDEDEDEERDVASSLLTRTRPPPPSTWTPAQDANLRRILEDSETPIMDGQSVGIIWEQIGPLLTLPRDPWEAEARWSSIAGTHEHLSRWARGVVAR